LRGIVLEGGFGIENLTERDVEVPTPGARELLVRMEAASLNYVDLAIVEGTLDSNLRFPFVPVADGAGVVEQVGPLVDGFRVGDLVTTMYIPPWRSGRYEQRYTSLAIRPGGGHVPGQLAQYKLFTLEEVVLAPPYLSATEAATLPISALTAWNALAYGEARAGDAVLIHGTGGVSLFALQFAKLLGLRTIITSRSDEKLQRATDLGADCTINYAETADLAHDVAGAGGPDGIALIVETVGGDNLGTSISFVRPEGHISVVGFLSGVAATIDLVELNLNRVTLTGVSVGSVQDFGDMNRALAQHRMRPVIDSTYALTDAAAAFRRLKSGRHFGKVVICVGTTLSTPIKSKLVGGDAI